MEEIDFQVKHQSLKTFKDVPDEIRDVSITESYNDRIVITWSPPDSNNSEIIEYMIYLSDSTISNIGSTELKITNKKHEFKIMGVSKTNQFTLSNLQGNSAYYVLITAMNKNGEGYKAD